MKNLEYYLINNNLTLQVIDTNGHVLYKKDDAQKGKFAFTTDEYDMFEVCFQSEGLDITNILNFLTRQLLRLVL